MKRIRIILLSALFLSMANVHAEDVLTVDNVTLPQNGEVALELKAQLETNFTQFQIEIVLDEGLGVTLNKSNRPWGELGDTESTDHTISSSTPAAHTFRYVISSMNQMRLPDSEVLLRVKIVPDGTPDVGTVLHGTITNILFSERTASGTNVGHNFDDIPFTVTIGDPIDPRTLLDENATVAPTDATGVDIRVKRTIKANEWSTICLPFAMTEEQTKAAFGDDVELADFTGCETEYDNDDNIVSLKLNFSNVTAIEANHPYIIKVTKAVAEFTVDGVDIEVEDEPSVDCDEWVTGSGTKKDPYVYHYNSFVGTYAAQTEVPELTLFISGNQFWYSTGLTKMKAFRGYFDFYDVLTSVEDGNYSSRIEMSFNGGDTTGIHDNSRETITDNRCYDLQGRRVDKTVKGLYVKGGKKVIIK
jgi:hypothetical protein